MKSLRPALFALLAMLLAAAHVSRGAADSKAPAPDKNLDPRGRPERADNPKGVYTAIWYEDGQWHLRCNGPQDKLIRFTGTVTVTVGAITHGGTQGLEKEKKRTPESDWIEVHPGNRGFDYHFGNRGRTDGLDFKVSERTETITFKVMTAGNDNPDRVFVGKAGKHPEKIPFTLPANPEKE